ncbi:MAG: cytidine deaminase [Marinilabiliaceae bacterium]|nr:cytidine deaminase [Marinilabiliaceae bacterium]
MNINKEIIISYQEFDSTETLSTTEQLLIQKANEIRNNSYSPYSNFKVGAAILFDDGSITTGSNQENAAFPSGLCAERVALFYANSQFPTKKIIQIAIIGGYKNETTDTPITPCGSCRQVLIESESRQSSPIELLLVGEKKIWKISTAKALLPLSFSSNNLTSN